MTRLASALALAALLCGGQPCAAALSRAALGTVAAAPTPGATVPLDLALTDLGGTPHTFGEVLGGRPALLVLADFRCTQLCGSLLAIAAQALRGSGLVAGRDITLAVVGFDPDATARDGAALQADALGAFPDLSAGARLLTGDSPTIARLERAVGFTAVRDVDAGRYAHPADLFVLTPDGRVSHVLDGLALDPASLRLALVDAGQGRIGSLIDRLHVLCYGLDPLTGASTDLAQTMLRVGASALLLGAGGVAVLAWRRRGPPGGPTRPVRADPGRGA